MLYNCIIILYAGLHTGFGVGGGGGVQIELRTILEGKAKWEVYRDGGGGEGVIGNNAMGGGGGGGERGRYYTVSNKPGQKKLATFYNVSRMFSAMW